MADTLVDLERKFYIQQLGLSVGVAAIASPTSENYKATIDLAENMPRVYGPAGNGIVINPGGKPLMLAIYLTAGMSISSIVLSMGSTAPVGQTNFWCSLWDPSLNKIAVSPDEGASVVPSSTDKVFTLTGGPYPISISGLYYVGICFVGTSAPALFCSSAHSIVTRQVPTLNAQTVVAGLTNPASCPPSVVLSPATGGNSIPYLRVR